MITIINPRQPKSLGSSNILNNRFILVSALDANFKFYSKLLGNSNNFNFFSYYFSNAKGIFYFSCHFLLSLLASKTASCRTALPLKSIVVSTTLSSCSFFSLRYSRRRSRHTCSQRQSGLAQRRLTLPFMRATTF